MSESVDRVFLGYGSTEYLAQAPDDKEICTIRVDYIRCMYFLVSHQQKSLVWVRLLVRLFLERGGNFLFPKHG